MKTIFPCLAVLIVFLIQDGMSMRHRHRHRHRHRGKLPLFVLSGTDEKVYPYPMGEGTREGLHYAIVDEPSLLQIMELIQVNKTFIGDDVKNDKEEFCSYKEKVEDGIRRALKFYSTHLETQGETAAAGLAFLNGLEKKNGKNLTDFSYSTTIAKLCEGVPIQEDIGFCFEYVKAFGDLGEKNFERKDLSSLEYLEGVGEEKEVLFDELNAACLGALLLRCEVPQACHRVMFDPEPKTQYMLTHQLLHRMLAGQLECLKDKEKYVEPEVERNLCAKMYSEAKLISSLERNVPLTMLRDLFAEQIFFCGHIGYDNFFRLDWLKKILSWQSQSEYGCFLQEDPLTMDVDEVPRKLTNEEVEQGVETKEVCETHFTSVGLSTLGVFWDFMEKAC